MNGTSTSAVETHPVTDIGVSGTDWHPLSEEARQVATYYFNAVISRGGWPWARLPVVIEYGVAEGRVARYRLEEGEIHDDGLHGTVILRLDLHYLVQQPETVLRWVLPEIVCRIVEAIQKASGKPALSWAAIYAKLTGGAARTASEIEQTFSRLAEGVDSGNRLAACGCPGRDRFRVMDDQEAIRMAEGRIRCDTCSERYELVSAGHQPAWLRDELAFIAAAREASEAGVLAAGADSQGERVVAEALESSAVALGQGATTEQQTGSDIDETAPDGE